ncbi:MAG: TadE/TadG family type IV pilus assembly protein [Acidimicrobiia bacterium]
MRRLRDERGDATVEAVLAVPVLLLLVLLVIQFGLYYHAAHSAEAAAQEGARAARVEGASAADGEDRARTFMADAAPTLVHDVTITASRDADNARVEVRGIVHAIVPGLDLTVRADAESPVERFRPDTP